jgi:hypothetical protein
MHFESRIVRRERRTWRRPAGIAAAVLLAGTSPIAAASQICPCLGDISGNGNVGGEDLAVLLGAWGSCGSCVGCSADLSGDCAVDAIDLGILLGAWGPCGPIPDNDLCSNATVIVSATGSANPFCTFGANTDGPAQTCGVPAFTSIDGDVWFRYTPSLTGTMQIGICADFDVRFAVYGPSIFGGCGCPSGLFPAPLLGCAGTESLVACPTGAALLVPVTAGQCYTIRVGGAPGQRGSGNLDINVYPPPCEIVSSTKLTAAGLEANTQFGISTDMHGGVAVSGAIFDDLFIGGSNAGSARVYRYVGNTWTAEQSLFSPEPFASQRFGVTVATSGEWIAVGAGDAEPGCLADPDCDTGIVYLFEDVGGSWVFDQSLLPAAGDGSPKDAFGTRVDLDGPRAIVAANDDDNVNGVRAGAAYVFERITLLGSTFWIQTAKLLASDGANFDRFGSDVAVSGTWAIVGADSDDPGGSAYLFEDTGSGWPQRQKLVPAGLPAGSDFGSSVAIDGDVAVVGAPDFGTGTGRVYVYERFGGLGWLLTATLTPPDGANGDAFGSSISVAGDQLLVGARGHLGRGAAYLYWRVNGGWIQRAKLTAADGAADDAFGGSVAIDGGLGLVGAYFDNIGLAPDVGSVYRFNGLFECTGNGIADACDIANGLPDADEDGIPDSCEP